MDLSFLQYQPQRKKLRLLLTGGGSGGHTFPLIAVLRELKKIAASQRIPLEILYIGPKDFTLPYIEKEGIMVKTIITGKLRRRFSLNNFLDFFKTIGGIFQALAYVYSFMPDVVFSKGGYGAFPVTFWSILFFIPLYIHESDTVPGLVNHLTGRFARKVFISFVSTKKFFSAKKTILTGNPVRIDLVLSPTKKEATKKLLGLEEKKPVLTIIGGSQGSQHINSLVLDILPKIIPQMEVIHQTGIKNYQNVKREADIVFREIVGIEQNKKYYHPFAFFEEKNTPALNSFRDVLLVSDLIVARAGSGLIFEIALSKKPSILVPLPWSSRGHQVKNAYEYARQGAAVVVEESNLKPDIFSDLLLRLINDEKKKESMSEAAQKFAKPKAAQEIAQYLLQSVTLLR